LGLDNEEACEEYERICHRQPGLTVGEAMSHGLPRRFWLESILGSANGIAAVFTLFWHD
jgi:hypothetical protein